MNVDATGFIDNNKCLASATINMSHLQACPSYSHVLPEAS